MPASCRGGTSPSHGVSTGKMEWDDSSAHLLCQIADEASIREKLHRQSYYYYSSRQKFFQLPIIVLSVLSGSVQFLSQSYTGLERELITITGGVSVLTAVLGSIQSYLKLGEKASKHEAAEVNWQGLYNSIKHTLGLARERREDCEEFIARVQQEYQSLFKNCPILEQRFINQAKRALKKKADDYKTPNYLNGVSHMTEWTGWEENSV